MVAPQSEENVVGFKDADWKEPCVKVTKLRAAETWADWCPKHHHWLTPQEAVNVPTLLAGVNWT